MTTHSLYLVAADGVLLVHLLFVVFVVFGLVTVLLGGAYGWRWVRNPWLRAIHLICIAVVVIQSWLGIRCPLTILEASLRDKAGVASYTGSFIAHWVERLLYYEAPPWVFTALYTLFGTAVVASWFWVRPRSLWRSKGRRIGSS